MPEQHTGDLFHTTTCKNYWASSINQRRECLSSKGHVSFEFRHKSEDKAERNCRRTYCFSLLINWEAIMETNPSGCSLFSAAVLNTVLLLDPLAIASSVQFKKKKQ